MNSNMPSKTGNAEDVFGYGGSVVENHPVPGVSEELAQLQKAGET